jgi:hypothetical protein
MISNYPLCWPEGWKRTESYRMQRAKFGRSVQVEGRSWKSKQDLSVYDSLSRVLEQLERMGIDRQDVIISSNVPTRLDGMPRSGSGEPKDHGVAVYWKERNKPMRCMAIDRYDRVADNLAAVAATLDAMRAIERHGGAQILDRAFTGFAALPEKASQPWRETLGLQGEGVISIEVVESRFKELARKHHPDVGGDAEKFRQLVEARDAARLEVARG